MAIYKVAELYLEFTPKYEHLKEYAEKYLYTGEYDPDDVINLDVPKDFFEKKQKENPYLSIAMCEYIWMGAIFALKLLERKGFVIHASAVAYEGYAYLFSADSGTGKSTHTGFWQEVFGADKAVILNDDKPAVREIDGRFCASGTMFSGKSPLSDDITVPVKALCFIHRSEQNEIKRLSVGEALPLLFEQTLRPRRSEKILELTEILDGFLRSVPVYSLGVTYSPDSARFAYEALQRSYS